MLNPLTLIRGVRHQCVWGVLQTELASFLQLCPGAGKAYTAALSSGSEVCFILLVRCRPPPGKKDPCSRLHALQAIRRRMELSPEVLHLIIRNVTTRNDLVTLSFVSKRFQKEAERALYNTLHLRGHERTMAVCRVLSSTSRVSTLVEAISIFVGDHKPPESSSDESDEEEDAPEDPPVPGEYWFAVASALKQTKRLRFLSVYFEQIGDAAQAWVLDGSAFQLETFHCDFEWDRHLADFLHSQSHLSDLYLSDYRNTTGTKPPPNRPACPHNCTSAPSTLPIPALSILECTFSEAAAALVPGRPVVRVKTCLSRSQEDEKRKEMQDLVAQLVLSCVPLQALDLADESYTEDFSLELARHVGSLANTRKLRYLGTLVLPVDGTKVRIGALQVPLNFLIAIPYACSAWSSTASCAAFGVSSALSSRCRSGTLRPRLRRRCARSRTSYAFIAPQYDGSYSCTSSTVR